MTTTLQPVTNELLPVAEAELAKIADEYGSLTINGLADKGGFQQVHKARMVVKGYRVDIEKKRKELKADVLERGRMIDAEAKRLTGIIAPVEDHLAAEEQAYTDAIEAIKREEEEKRQAILIDKVNKLAAVGFTTTTAIVEGWTDEQFATTLEEAGKMFAAEQERLAKQREFEEAEFKRQHLEIERRGLLSRLNFSTELDLGRMDSAVFDELLAKAEAAQIERERLKAEEEAKLRAEREALETERRKLAEEKAAAEQAERERQAAERARQEERDRIEREKQAAEAKAKADAEAKAKAEALRPDKEKIFAIGEAIQAVHIPPLSDAVDTSTVARIIKIRDEAARDIRLIAGELA